MSEKEPVVSVKQDFKLTKFDMFVLERLDMDKCNEFLSKLLQSILRSGIESTKFESQTIPTLTMSSLRESAPNLSWFFSIVYDREKYHNHNYIRNTNFVTLIVFMNALSFFQTDAKMLKKTWEEQYGTKSKDTENGLWSRRIYQAIPKAVKKMEEELCYELDICDFRCEKIITTMVYFIQSHCMHLDARDHQFLEEYLERKSVEWDAKDKNKNTIREKPEYDEIDMRFWSLCAYLLNKTFLSCIVARDDSVNNPDPSEYTKCSNNLTMAMCMYFHAVSACNTIIVHGDDTKTVEFANDKEQFAKWYKNLTRHSEPAAPAVDKDLERNFHYDKCIEYRVYMLVEMSDDLMQKDSVELFFAPYYYASLLIRFFNYLESEVSNQVAFDEKFMVVGDAISRPSESKYHDFGIYDLIYDFGLPKKFDWLLELAQEDKLLELLENLPPGDLSESQAKQENADEIKSSAERKRGRRKQQLLDSDTQHIAPEIPTDSSQKPKEGKPLPDKNEAKQASADETKSSPGRKRGRVKPQSSDSDAEHIAPEIPTDSSQRPKRGKPQPDKNQNKKVPPETKPIEKGQSKKSRIEEVQIDMNQIHAENKRALEELGKLNKPALECFLNSSPEMKAQTKTEKVFLTRSSQMLLYRWMNIVNCFPDSVRSKVYRSMSTLHIDFMNHLMAFLLPDQTVETIRTLKSIDIASLLGTTPEKILEKIQKKHGQEITKISDAITRAYNHFKDPANESLYPIPADQGLKVVRIL